MWVHCAIEKPVAYSLTYDMLARIDDVGREQHEASSEEEMPFLVISDRSDSTSEKGSRRNWLRVKKVGVREYQQSGLLKPTLRREAGQTS